MPEEVIAPAGGEAPSTEVASDQSVVEGAALAEATPATVNIDGTEYTLDEVKSGMLRQADYTRKTQDLAIERQQQARAIALWEALGEDPVGAIEALQEHFADALTPAEALDPNDEFKRDVQSFMEKQQEREAIANVNTELARLETQFGRFDRDALLQHAIDHQIPSLEVALIHQRATNPAAGAQAQQAAADAAALAAKQALPAVAGANGAAGSLSAGDGKPITSVKGALAAALAEAGLDSLSSLS